MAKKRNNENIEIRGARVNNLKNIDVNIPRNTFTIVTGLSGSGKSSLAYDTLYAEGQRRYVESLSAYARQFLGRMHKPECDYIKGIPPAIAISNGKQQLINTFHDIKPELSQNYLDEFCYKFNRRCFGEALSEDYSRHV